MSRRRVLVSSPFLSLQGEAFVSLNITKKRGVARQRFFLNINSTWLRFLLAFSEVFYYLHFIFILNIVFFALYKLTVLYKPPKMYKLILIVLGALTGLPHVFFLTIKQLHNPFAVNEVKSNAILDFIA